MERRSSDEHVDQLLTRSLARGAAPGGVCPAADMLAAFVDGGLDQAERGRVTEHAGSCSRCAQILAIVVDLAATPEGLAAPVPARPWVGRWRWMVPIATAATVAGIWIATRDNIRPIVPRPPVTQTAPAESVAEPPSVSPTPPETTGGRVVAVQPPARAVEQRSPDKSTKSTTRTESVLPEARRDAAESMTATRDQASAREAPPVPVAAPPPPSPPAVPAAAPPAAVAAPQDALSARPPAQGQGRGGGAGGGRFAGGVVGGVVNETVTVAGEAPVADAQNSARQAMSIPLWRLSGTLVQRSLDGARTWTTEYEAPRTLLGGSTPTADAGWFVGVRGLIVRRAGSTWSLVNAPANVDVVSVQATNERTADITLADGRGFATTDAGATWTRR